MKSFFESNKKESRKTWIFRQLMNLFPVYRGTGGRIIFISSDWKEAVVRLKLNWRTRNYVGTIFGGSLYAAADPILMLQLIRILGKDYVVWDKAAAIRFRRPGTKTIQMQFLISETLLETIKSAVANEGEYEFSEQLKWVDSEGKVYALVDKTIYVANKEFYKNKRNNKL
jgi:acyl-coenzyme A thioesterase PaaI-like protein